MSMTLKEFVKQNKNIEVVAPMSEAGIKLWDDLVTKYIRANVAEAQVSTTFRKALHPTDYVRTTNNPATGFRAALLEAKHGPAQQVLAF